MEVLALASLTFMSFVATSRVAPSVNRDSSYAESPRVANGQGSVDLQGLRSVTVRTNLGPRKVVGGKDVRHQRINGLLEQSRGK